MDKLHIEYGYIIKSKMKDEKIYFSDKIQKKTVEMFSKAQERSMVITNLALYNLKGTEIKRRIKIDDLKAITISKISNQFIIHGNQKEYDYLYIYPNKKKIVKILQTIYETSTGKDLLFCKKNEKDLSKYVVSKKERTKNPYLFKIESSELTPIKDYIESLESYEEKQEPQNIIESNKTFSKIENKDNISNQELSKQLNEEKNKNIELKNKIESEKNNYLKKIKDLEKLINEKDKQFNNLKKKENNELISIINPGEEVLAINFTSTEQDINYPMACKNTTLISRLEEKLYNKYPKYKDFQTYLTVNGNVVNRFKTVEENGIKNGNSIIVNKFE